MHFFQMFRTSATEFKQLRTITLTAMLAAIYAVSYSPFAGNFIIIPGVIEIRFGFLAIAIAAMLFGPVPAVCAAIVGDFIGTLLFYGGNFFGGYTISWSLQAIMFALFFYKHKVSIPRIIGAMTLNSCLIQLLLTTYWESVLGYGTFQALFFKRILHNAIMLPINSILLFFILTSVLGIYRRISCRPA